MAQVRQLIRTIWKTAGCRICLAVAVALVLGIGAGHAFIGAVYVVEGTSMEPSYPPGTRLYGAPISTPLERGDVVLLDDGRTDYALKRIIGLPGETVQLWRGQVFINRQMLVEPYLDRYTFTYPIERGRRGATYVLDDDQYLVLGDNRPNSADSRSYGPVEANRIKRRVPLPENFASAYFAPFTLPSYGSTLARPIAGRKSYAGSGR